MNKEFRDIYNRELEILYERAREFAEDFPGIAERLGGLTRDKLDPGLAGLLEGAAFLAARVQLKLKSEFSTFTEALIEQLLPDYLAPTPAAMLVQALPDFSDTDLAKGKRFAPGRYLDATYLEREQRIACQFRLSAPLELWPLAIPEAKYHASPAALQALGLEVQPGTAAGLQLRLTRPSGEDSPKRKPTPISEIAAERLPVQLMGARADTVALYEQLFADCTRITLRYLDAQGDPVFLPCPPDMLVQRGFDEEESLFPEDSRVFRGFQMLREFYVLPQKFLGFRLENIRGLLRRVPAESCDLIFEFGHVNPKLAPVIGPESFALFTVPAVNLFIERCSRVKIDGSKSEYLVVPDHSPTVNFEVNRILEVNAHYAGLRKKVRVNPIYSLPEDGTAPDEALYYSYRRRPRRLSERERRFGLNSDYTGSETFIALYEPEGLDTEDRVQRLQVETLCSNRHLTEQLPIGQSGVDFRLTDDVTVPLRCVAGPTPPRPSLVEAERQDPRVGGGGEVLWRLINFLSFNHLGLMDRHGGDPAASLREVLALFADLSDSVTARQVRGLTGVSARPVTRSIRRPDGFHAARGTEVRLNFDERAFEGSGILLIGAVLDRFLADYAHVNSFTQTVLVSDQRGEVMRFAPRSGTGPLI